MTTKINNENAESGLLPYPVIIAATKGDPEAMKIGIWQSSGPSPRHLSCTSGIPPQ